MIKNIYMSYSWIFLVTLFFLIENFFLIFFFLAFIMSNILLKLPNFIKVVFSFLTANHGRLHWPDGNVTDTKYTIKEEGMYKLFVAITTVSNDTLCQDSSENFVRVELEYPEQILTILMYKKWKCKENRSSGLNYLLPMDISDTFHLPKGGNVSVVVKERSQLYPYDKSNHFGLIKIK